MQTPTLRRPARISGVQKLIPGALPLKAQEKALAGKFAIEPVELLRSLAHPPGGRLNHQDHGTFLDKASINGRPPQRFRAFEDYLMPRPDPSDHGPAAGSGSLDWLHPCFTHPDNGRTIQGPYALAQQVLWNQLKNAAKFTPEGGEITVRSRNEWVASDNPDRIVIEVSDSGIGFDAEAADRIFEPFTAGAVTFLNEAGERSIAALDGRDWLRCGLSFETM